MSTHWPTLSLGGTPSLTPLAVGFGSPAVITGDMSQIDLPRGTASGLTHACEVLAGVEAISFTHFQSRDVVRHPIVQSIVDAYDAHESDL